MNLAFARITKVDEITRTVYGRATQELLDRDNEIMDYATSKPEFMRWSQSVFADSNGKSYGNVRSMHGNIAAGKLTDISFDDNERAIDVAAKIVDDKEWQKVIDGVYTGFSIGGRYGRKWPDILDGKSVQRYTAVPAELSIVDRPCLSTAKFFSIHKFDGSVMRKAFRHQEHTSMLIPNPGSDVEGRHSFLKFAREALAKGGRSEIARYTGVSRPPLRERQTLSTDTLDKLSKSLTPVRNPHEFATVSNGVTDTGSLQMIQKILDRGPQRTGGGYNPLAIRKVSLPTESRNGINDADTADDGADGSFRDTPVGNATATRVGRHADSISTPGASGISSSLDAIKEALNPTRALRMGP